jgi:hypothetical protein
MANWAGIARSNYFRVKDVTAYATAIPAEVSLRIASDPEGRVCVLANDTDDGGWPTQWWGDSDTDYEEHDFDIATLTAEHLVEGSIAVFMQVGAEKMRYLTGHAFAIDHKGVQVAVDLEDELTKKARAQYGDDVEITAASF